jgi:predicted DNA-binding transcriptional regulator YafY
MFVYQVYTEHLFVYNKNKYSYFEEVQLMKSLLLNAAETGERLEMIYMSNKSEISQRIIKILAVTDDSFKAYCYTRKQFRTFTMSNVLSIGHHRKHKVGA